MLSPPSTKASTTKNSPLKITHPQRYFPLYLQYIKRYLNETNLSFTVEKMMGVLLKLDKLPENPYNLMYRLIHHEAIY